eukprot:6118378-Pyramimonas_sp.AAC.1
MGAPTPTPRGRPGANQLDGPSRSAVVSWCSLELRTLGFVPNVSLLVSAPGMHRDLDEILGRKRAIEAVRLEDIVCGTPRLNTILH